MSSNFHRCIFKGWGYIGITRLFVSQLYSWSVLKKGFASKPLPEMFFYILQGNILRIIIIKSKCSWQLPDNFLLHLS